MKRLQLGYRILVIFFISVLFSNCACSKKDNSIYSLTQNPPFTILEIYSQEWVAGIQGGGTGINLYFEIDTVEPETMINTIYFRNKTVKAENKSKNIFVGYIKNKENRDVIMDSNSLNEAKNIPPQKFPFKLKQSEAVISYIYKGKDYYYKVSNIIEKEIIAYPQSNPKIDK